MTEAIGLSCSWTELPVTDTIRVLRRPGRTKLQWSGTISMLFEHLYPWRS